MPLDIKSKIQGVIFDLDGVIVDTARFHFTSWKTIASEWNYQLKIEDNERLLQQLMQKWIHHQKDLQQNLLH